MSTRKPHRDSSPSHHHKRVKTTSSSMSKTSTTTQSNEDEDITSSSNIFDIDHIISEIASFCDYHTRVTTIRSLSKRTKKVVNEELYNMIVKPSVPFCTPADARNKPEFTIEKREGDEWSDGYNSREDFVEHIWDEKGDDIEHMCEQIIGGKRKLKSKINAFRRANGSVELGQDIEFKSDSDDLDMVHEWNIGFEHYDHDHELIQDAIKKTFFTNNQFRRNRCHDEGTMRTFKKILFGLLVNAKEITYYKLVFHMSGYPDVIAYEHCGDDLDFYKGSCEAVLTVLMPDETEQFEVVVKSAYGKRLMPPTFYRGW